MPSADPRDRLFELKERRSSLAQEAGRSASVVILFSLLRIGLTLGSTAVLARFVTPADHGTFAMVLPVVLIASGLSEFGLAQAVVQQRTVTHRLVTTLFWTNVALGLLLALGVASFGPIAAEFYGVPGISQIFLWLCPYVILIVMNTQFVAILRRQFQFRQIELTSFLASGIAAAVAVWMAIQGYGIDALIVQLLLQPALNFMGLVWVARWVPSAPWKANFNEAKSALNFGGYLAAERLMGELGRNLQLIIIGRTFSETQLAYFYRSSAIAQMPQRRLGAPLLGAFLPALSRAQEDASSFEALFVRVLSRSNLMLIPAGAVLVLMPDIVTSILLGPNWSGATPVLQMLGFLPIFAMSLTCMAQALIALGKSRELFLFRCVSFGLLLATLLFSAPYGLHQMVGAYLLVLIFGQGSILVWVTVRHTPLSFSTLLRSFSIDLSFATVLIAPAYFARLSFEYGQLVECAGALIWICLVLLTRIFRSEALRHDFYRVFRPAKAGP